VASQYRRMSTFSGKALDRLAPAPYSLSTTASYSP
jgi:hypothetical protein